MKDIGNEKRAGIIHTAFSGNKWPKIYTSALISGSIWEYAFVSRRYENMLIKNAAEAERGFSGILLNNAGRFFVRFEQEGTSSLFILKIPCLL